MSVVSSASGRPACLIDASIYIFRYYFSLPDNWFSQSGNPTAAVYGYTQFLLSFLHQVQPSYIVVCFDESLGSCFRNQLYANYKSSRVLPDELLAYQLQACREVTQLLGIQTLASDVYEADDLIGSCMTLLHQYEPDLPVAILTKDKDLGQLLKREQDYLWDYMSPNKQVRHDRQAIYDKFGVWPEQLVDYLALVGDPVDDIPGVIGIGAKTASRLLQWAGSLEQIFTQWEDIAQLPLRGASTLQARLLADTEQLAISRCLAEIIVDIDWSKEATSLQTASDLRHRTVDVEGFQIFCKAMGLPARFNDQCEQWALEQRKYNESIKNCRG